MSICLLKCLEQQQKLCIFYLPSINNTGLQNHKEIPIRKRTWEILRQHSVQSCASYEVRTSYLSLYLIHKSSRWQHHLSGQSFFTTKAVRNWKSSPYISPEMKLSVCLLSPSTHPCVISLRPPHWQEKATVRLPQCFLPTRLSKTSVSPQMENAPAPNHLGKRGYAPPWLWRFSSLEDATQKVQGIVSLLELCLSFATEQY